MVVVVVVVVIIMLGQMLTGDLASRHMFSFGMFDIVDHEAGLEGRSRRLNLTTEFKFYGKQRLPKRDVSAKRIPGTATGGQIWRGGRPIFKERGIF